jgi:hypothetical protein
MLVAASSSAPAAGRSAAGYMLMLPRAITLREVAAASANVQGTAAGLPLPAKAGSQAGTRCARQDGWHEFVVSMLDMHTAECFVYYELIMRSAEHHFGPQAAASMQYFFLDVACKVHKYYAR